MGRISITNSAQIFVFLATLVHVQIVHSKNSEVKYLKEGKWIKAEAPSTSNVNLTRTSANKSASNPDVWAAPKRNGSRHRQEKTGMQFAGSYVDPTRDYEEAEEVSADLERMDTLDCPTVTQTVYLRSKSRRRTVHPRASTPDPTGSEDGIAPSNDYFDRVKDSQGSIGATLPDMGSLSPVNIPASSCAKQSATTQFRSFVYISTQFIYSTVTESAANRDAAETVTVPVTVYADPVTEYLPTIAADPVTVYAEPITKYRTVTIKLQSEPSARYQKEPSDKYFQKLPENPVPILSTVTVTVPPRCPLMPCTAVLKVCLDERDRKTQQSQPSDDVLTIGRKRCRFPAQKEQQFRVIKPSVRLRGDTATIWKRSIAPEENTIARTVFDYDFRGNFVRIISEDLANPSPHIERLRNMEENLQMAGSKNTDIVAAESFPNDSTNNYDQSLFRDDYRGHSEQSGATKSPGTTSENSNSFQDNQDMALSRLSGGANTDHSVNDTSSPFNGMSRDSETSPEGDGLPEIPGPHKQHELPVTFLRKPENEPDRDNEAYGSTWPDKKVRQLPNFSNDILADRNANRFAGHTSTAPLAAPAGQMSEPSLLSSSSDIHTVGDSIPVKRIFTVKEPPLRYGSDDEAVDKYSVMERKVVNLPLVEVANRPGKNSVRYYKSDGILYPYHADEPEPIFRPKEVVYGTEDSLLEPSSVRNNDYPRNNGHFIEVYC